MQMVPIRYQVAGRSAREISGSVEDGIRDGALIPGELLPSVRVLAGQLDVAPGTVAAAYRLLADRGLLEARGRSGTRVRFRPPLAARSASSALAPGVVDLAGGQPDPRLLPALRALPRSERTAGAPPVPVLAELLALGRHRIAADGVPADALTLSSGGLDGIGRVLTARLRPGDTVAVEDPGWPNALDMIAALGLRTAPLAIDVAGPRPESLRAALRAGASAVILTNRAQNPTGGFLTPRRAAELRTVMTRHPQTVVVEDDHAAELAGVELATLAGATASWAFVRSTSKPYGPDLRVALLAGDEATIARVEGRIRVGSGWVSTLLQRLVVALWTGSRPAAVVAKAAATYDARRLQLIGELAARGIASAGETGLNVWVPVEEETAVVTGLLRSGWAVAPGARFRQVSRPGVRITVSQLSTATIPRLADDVASALCAAPAAGYTA